eukprot:TRINITY_DN9108_c1_g1_i4.p1 TRINITY_DN9108_c1_g1~~TRINITY_DN9108_c1_g1_i4.p1  ORF type:complete len:272 (-),score=35.53 TRINITY_DN9108_c1_g1_i4:95-910(-)
MVARCFCYCPSSLCNLYFFIEHIFRTMQTEQKGVVAALDELISSTPVCSLSPFSFFISWQGVLTLAYSGFPQPLLDLKQRLNQNCSNLPKENPGSKWPKTTLGAVQDNRRITPEEFEKLKAICLEQIGVLQSSGSKVRIDDLSVVFYECRSLERVLSRQDFVLVEQEENCSEMSKFCTPGDGELENVKKIVSEWDEQGYWMKASKDGNRENHYRVSACGVTLIHYLSCKSQDAGLINVIESFRKQVDEQLPGLYSWFQDQSLHITVRALHT